MPWPWRRIALPPAALAGAAGAALSVLQGIQEPSATWDLAPPEVAGMRTIFRLVGPPAVVVIGCLPILLARVGLDNDGDPWALAETGALGALVVVGLAVGWIHRREEIKAWFRAAQEQAGMAGPSPATATATTSTSASPAPVARPAGRKPAPTKVTTTLPRKR